MLAFNFSSAALKSTGNVRFSNAERSGSPSEGGWMCTPGILSIVAMVELRADSAPDIESSVGAWH